MALVKYIKKKLGKKEGDLDNLQITSRSSQLTPHPVLEGAVASAPPEEKITSWLSFEMDIKVDLVLDPGETELWKMMTPLINMQLDYKGDLRHKNLWLGLFIITASGLHRCPVDKENRVYSIRIRRGIKVGFSGQRAYETEKVIQWNQSMNYLADGLHSNWTVRGVLIRTLVNYPPYIIKSGQEQYLQSIGVSCLAGEEGELIFIH